MPPADFTNSNFDQLKRPPAEPSAYQIPEQGGFAKKEEEEEEEEMEEGEVREDDAFTSPLPGWGSGVQQEFAFPDSGDAPAPLCAITPKLEDEGNVVTAGVTVGIRFKTRQAKDALDRVRDSKVSKFRLNGHPEFAETRFIEQRMRDREQLQQMERNMERMRHGMEQMAQDVHQKIEEMDQLGWKMESAERDMVRLGGGTQYGASGGPSERPQLEHGNKKRRGTRGGKNTKKNKKEKERKMA